MIKIFHTADIHIGARTKHLGDRLFDIQRNFLKKLCTEADKEKADFIVICGDLFDSNFVPSSICSQVFEIILSTNIPSIIIPGGGSREIKEITGHDAYSDDSIYKRPELQRFFKHTNIKLLTPDKDTTIISHTAFYASFFDIPNKEKIKNAKYHIALIHGAFSENPVGDELPISKLNNLYFDFICLGHYHSFKKFKNAAYPGCLVQFEFLKNKKAASGYAKIFIDNNVDIQYRQFKNAPRFYKLEVISYDDIEKIKDDLDKDCFIQITGYSKEFIGYIEELSKHKNIIISDTAIIYERNGIYGIIEDSLDEILNDLKIKDEDLLEEIKQFILRNIRGNITKPTIENYLIDKFLS